MNDLELLFSVTVFFKAIQIFLRVFGPSGRSLCAATSIAAGLSERHTLTAVSLSMSGIFTASPAEQPVALNI